MGASVLNKDIKRVFILEDQPVCLSLLTKSLRRVFGNVYIESAASMSRSLEHLKTPFTLYLIDLNVLDGISLNFIQSIRKKYSDAVIIVTTIYADDELIFSALKAGASGYLLKSDGYEVIETLLKSFQNGVPAISPYIARRLIEHFNAPGMHEYSTHDTLLTNREKQVLQRIGKGLLTKQIAEDLNLSHHTINDVIKRVYKKFNIHNRAEAAVIAKQLYLSN